MVKQSQLNKYEKYILEEIHRLKKRAAQESDIPYRIIKENSMYIFCDYLLSSFDDAIDKSYFPTAVKQANIMSVFKTERYSKGTDL